jgi:hypothetical protein
MLATALLLAGTDTARNQVAAASIEVLCDNPDQWKLLRDKPDLAMSAVCLGANLARLEIAEAPQNRHPPDPLPAAFRTGSMEAGAWTQRTDQPSDRLLNQMAPRSPSIGRCVLG